MCGPVCGLNVRGNLGRLGRQFPTLFAKVEKISGEERHHLHVPHCENERVGSQSAWTRLLTGTAVIPRANSRGAPWPWRVITSSFSVKFRSFHPNYRIFNLLSAAWSCYPPSRRPLRFQALSQPDFDDGPSSDAHPVSLSVQVLNHPDGQVHVDAFLFQVEPTHRREIQMR